MANEVRESAVGLPEGTKIGKYVVQERTAIGGQAIVYKAYDELLDRHVAIKQISSHLAEDPRFMERFREEAKILARLGAEQPVIVTIHELVEDEQGLFIVMEYIDGPTLERVLQENPEPIQSKAVLQILWRLASALHDVHRAGIIHRDLKPANLIIAEGLRPKIMDFGVAASLTGEESMPLGTTKYMAPELFEGEGVDGRADMYSLGMITYEMLVGREKFNEIFEEIVRDKQAEAVRWMKWHANEQVQAPPVHEVNPQAPKELSYIVSKMMAKDIHDRFETMEQLGLAIRTAFKPGRKGGGGLQLEPGRTGKPRRPGPSGPPAGAASPQRPGGEHEGEPDGTDPAPTAPVPKKKLSLKTKLTLLIILFVGILGTVTVLVVKRNREHAELVAKARAIYNHGVDAYQKAEFDAAIKHFEEVQQKYPTTKEAAQAHILVPISKARRLIASAEGAEGFNEAALALSEARKRAKVARKQRDDMDEWTRAREKNIATIERDRGATWQFREAIAEAENLFDEGQFIEGRRHLERRTSDLLLNDQQRSRMQAYRQKSRRREFEIKYAGMVAEADELRENQDFQAADAKYVEAEKLLESEEAIAALPKLERQKLDETLQQKRRLLADMQDEGSAKQAFANAQTDEDKLEAARAVLRFVTGEEKDKWEGTIARLEQRIRRKGVDAIPDVKLSQKIRKLTEYLKKYPNDADAKAELAKFKKLSQRRDLIAEGDRLFQGGKYDAALAKYSEAGKIAGLPPEPTLGPKIRDTNFQIQLGKADDLRAEGDYTKAIRAYTRLKSIKPDADMIISGRISQTKQQQQYAALVEKGSEALKSDLFDQALDHFNSAKRVWNRQPQIDDLLDLTRYKKYLKLGRDALDGNDLRAARAYLNRAKEFDDTAEVNNLLAEVERRMKESS